MEYLIIGLVLIAIVILVTRALGAWMLRINEVIREQKKTNDILIEILNQKK